MTRSQGVGATPALLAPARAIARLEALGYIAFWPAGPLRTGGRRGLGEE